MFRKTVGDVLSPPRAVLAAMISGFAATAPRSIDTAAKDRMVNKRVADGSW
jgi:hypothetical protein